MTGTEERDVLLWRHVWKAFLAAFLDAVGRIVCHTSERLTTRVQHADHIHLLDRLASLEALSLLNALQQRSWRRRRIPASSARHRLVATTHLRLRHGERNVLHDACSAA